MIKVLFLLIGIGILAVIASYISYQLALRWSVVDDPKSDLSRKKHKNPIPLMGATGSVILALSASSLVLFIAKYDIGNLQSFLYQGLFQPVRFGWVVIAVLLLMFAGYLDDSKKIGIKGRFAITGLALVITVFFGNLRIEALSFPFDQILPDIPLLPEFLAFFWIGFCLFTTKVLDGHDGLVTSVGAVGFLTIASVATFDNVNQPLLIILALIWTFSLLGFLPFNFPNAKAYLGDGGSMIIGYMIGVLSIMSGAKIATAGSVIGWFVIDLLFVWFRRILDGRNPLTSSDRFHWHQRLVESGLNKLQVLSISILVVLSTSRIGLMIETQNKLYVLIAQAFVLIVVFALTYSLTHQKNKPE